MFRKYEFKSETEANTYIEALGVDEETIERARQLRDKKEAMENRLLNHEKLLEAKKQTEGHNGNGAELEETAACEIESFQPEYENTFEDFSEMAIQFGYLALFSPAYPLAPLLAFLNNVFEIRVDANKLCYSVRRPDWELAEDIGSWSTVLSLLGYIAVVTNATMVTFVGKRLSETGWGLSEDEASGGLAARLENYKLWAMAVLFEHGILILVCIDVLQALNAIVLTSFVVESNCDATYSRGPWLVRRGSRDVVIQSEKDENCAANRAGKVATRRVQAQAECTRRHRRRRGRTDDYRKHPLGSPTPKKTSSR